MAHNTASIPTQDDIIRRGARHFGMTIAQNNDQILALPLPCKDITIILSSTTNVTVQVTGAPSVVDSNGDEVAGITWATLTAATFMSITTPITGIKISNTNAASRTVDILL